MSMGFRDFATLLSVIPASDEVTTPREAFGDGFSSDLPAPLYLYRLDQACLGSCLSV